MRGLGLVLALILSQFALAEGRKCDLTLAKPATIEIEESAKTYRIPPRLLNLPDITPLRDFVSSLGPTDVLVAKFSAYRNLYILATRDGYWMTSLAIPRNWFGRKRPLRMKGTSVASDKFVAEYAKSHGSLVLAIYEQPELFIPLVPVLPIKAVLSLFLKGPRRTVSVVTLPANAFAQLREDLEDRKPYLEETELPPEFRLDGDGTRLVSIDKSNYGVRLDQVVTGALTALLAAAALLQ